MVSTIVWCRSIWNRLPPVVPLERHSACRFLSTEFDQAIVRTSGKQIIYASGCIGIREGLAKQDRITRGRRNRTLTDEEWRIVGDRCWLQFNLASRDYLVGCFATNSVDSSFASVRSKKSVARVKLFIVGCSESHFWLLEPKVRSMGLL